MVVGDQVRGEATLLIFLVLATSFFCGLWIFEGAEQKQQMIRFMTSRSHVGTVDFLIANGLHLMSLKHCRVWAEDASYCLRRASNPLWSYRVQNETVLHCGGRDSQGDVVDMPYESICPEMIRPVSCRWRRKVLS